MSRWSETGLCSFVRLWTCSTEFIANGVNPSIGEKNQVVAPLNWLLASTRLWRETKLNQIGVRVSQNGEKQFSASSGSSER